MNTDLWINKWPSWITLLCRENYGLRFNIYLIGFRWFGRGDLPDFNLRQCWSWRLRRFILNYSTFPNYLQFQYILKLFLKNIDRSVRSFNCPFNFNHFEHYSNRVNYDNLSIISKFHEFKWLFFYQFHPVPWHLDQITRHWISTKLEQSQIDHNYWHRQSKLHLNDNIKNYVDRIDVNRINLVHQKCKLSFNLIINSLFSM